VSVVIASAMLVVEMAEEILTRQTPRCGFDVLESEA
jgi:hypothetical protein